MFSVLEFREPIDSQISGLLTATSGVVSGMEPVMVMVEADLILEQRNYEFLELRLLRQPSLVEHLGGKAVRL